MFVDELLQMKFFRVNKIGKWSEILKIIMPELKLHGSLIKKITIRVAELSVILVGLLIIARSDDEYILFN